jgi:uncharacterized protein (DUF362 family)
VNGALSTIEQRKILSFIDGIIAGEGNGPLRPLAKRVGYLSFCDDLACGDFIAAHFMGLDPESFPIIKQAFAAGKFPITQVKTAEIEARVNGLAYNQEKLASLGRNPLKLPAGWRKKEC